MPISLLSRIIDLVAPRYCPVCGRRMAIGERTLCTVCNLHLPRTNYAADAYENRMARLFWGKLPIERAAALFFYEAHSEVCNLVYDLKYHDRPEIGAEMGMMTAAEFARSSFFEGIDAIVPVPLSPKRQRQRGYNQSMEIARGVASYTGIPIVRDAVRRQGFKESQTHKSRMERVTNVEDAFRLHKGEQIRGRHVLVVDDVVTTGATVTACADELTKAGGVRISVLALGFAKP